MNAHVNEQVTEYIDKLTQEWQAEHCRAMRQMIHVAAPDVTERIQYGKPHFLREGKYFCVLGTAKGWVTLTIFNAAALEAPDGFFEPGDSDRKTVKILKGQTVDYDFLTQLLKQVADS